MCKRFTNLGCSIKYSQATQREMAVEIKLSRIRIPERSKADQNNPLITIPRYFLFLSPNLMKDKDIICGHVCISIEKLMDINMRNTV